MMTFLRNKFENEFRKGLYNYSFSGQLEVRELGLAGGAVGVGNVSGKLYKNILHFNLVSFPVVSCLRTLM